MPLGYGGNAVCLLMAFLATDVNTTFRNTFLELITLSIQVCKMSFTPVYFVTVDTSTKKAKRTFGTVVKVDLTSINRQSEYLHL